MGKAVARVAGNGASVGNAVDTGVGVGAILMIASCSAFTETSLRTAVG
jgi:hypothetical protein